MHEQILQQVGLTKDQASLYSQMIGNGDQTAGNIAKESPLKRGLVYKILDQLIELKLVEKKEKEGKVAHFRARHPSKLRDLIEKKEKEAQEAELALSGALPALVSEFNLAQGRPGIQYFEGVKGFEKILQDTLAAKSEILVFVDVEKLSEGYEDLNQRYTAKRNEKGIQRRILIPDTEFTRKYMKNAPKSELSEARLLPLTHAFHSAGLQIYNDKTSYITLKPETMIAIITEDALITQMHRALFEFAWSKANRLEQYRS